MSVQSNAIRHQAGLPTAAVVIILGAWLAVSLDGVTAQERTGSAPSCMLIDLDNDGVEFVPRERGVRFDLNGDGTAEQIGWTSSGASDAFLAIDINANGRIDGGRELVGSLLEVRGRRMPSGLRALIAMQDGVVLGPDFKATVLPKGSGQIDKDDRVYTELRVWVDSDHDGRSAPAELRTLAAAGITAIRTGMRGADTSRNGTETVMIGSVMMSVRGVDRPRPLLEVRLAR